MFNIFGCLTIKKKLWFWEFDSFTVDWISLIFVDYYFLHRLMGTIFRRINCMINRWMLYQYFYLRYFVDLNSWMIGLTTSMRFHIICYCSLYGCFLQLARLIMRWRTIRYPAPAKFIRWKYFRNIFPRNENKFRSIYL